MFGIICQTGIKFSTSKIGLISLKGNKAFCIIKLYIKELIFNDYTDFNSRFINIFARTMLNSLVCAE